MALVLVSVCLAPSLPCMTAHGHTFCQLPWGSQVPAESIPEEIPVEEQGPSEAPDGLESPALEQEVVFQPSDAARRQLLFSHRPARRLQASILSTYVRSFTLLELSQWHLRNGCGAALRC